MRHALLTALPLAFAATAALASGSTRFVCTPMGDGNYSVYIAPETPDEATAIYELGIDSGNTSSAITLRSAVTGSGFRYEGEGIAFFGQGDVATLTDGGMEATCVVYIPDDEGLDEATADAEGGAMGIPALAMGGNVRNGPGTEHAVVGSLRYGTTITLEEDTGVVWDGYTWFRIAEPGGIAGYVWGGIICVPEGGVTGVVDPCH